MYIYKQLFFIPQTIIKRGKILAIHWRTTKATFPDDTGPAMEDCVRAATGMNGEEYLQTMRVDAGSKISRHQWGGFLEASVVAKHLKCRVAIFQKELSKAGRASFRPLLVFGPRDAHSLKGTIGVSYDGSHYSSLKLSTDIVQALA